MLRNRLCLVTTSRMCRAAAIAALTSAALTGFAMAGEASVPRLSVTEDVPSNPAQLDTDNLVAEPMDAWSPAESHAVEFAVDLTGRALAVLDDPELQASDRRSAFRKLVVDLFDVKRISHILLGHNRDRLSPHQLENYQSIVADYLVPIYATRLGEVCNTQPTVVAVQERNVGVFVRTAFTTEMGAAPTYVDWLVDEQPDGSLRAVDISVSGVSLTQAKMDEFNSVIANRGPDAFLELLHKQAGDGLPTPMSAPVLPPTLPAVTNDPQQAL